MTISVKASKLYDVGRRNQRMLRQVLTVLAFLSMTTTSRLKTESTPAYENITPSDPNRMNPTNIESASDAVHGISNSLGINRKMRSQKTKMPTHKNGNPKRDNTR